MPHAALSLDPAFTIGPVPRRLFGSFVEHMGRSVYTGIFEPDHPLSDERGLRTDVLDLTREIGPTVVRYPGGNFVSGYRWEDGVGPIADRPRRLDLAWHSTESNEFGVAEFDAWARQAGAEVMMAVNLGTRGMQEACDLLEYTNHPSGTSLSDLRIRHGNVEPFGYKLWCLGNEMDGHWQIGHKTADEYGRLAAETGRAMRMIDPGIELVACGSSGSGMPTFGQWESTVLEHAYDVVDYISLHAYYEEHDGDPESFLASAVNMDRFIEDVIATADAVRARGRHKKRINLSFDEWNVWYIHEFGEDDHSDKTTDWPLAPRLGEDTYNVSDAVVVGTLLNSLLRHGDRVQIGCQAQLANVLGLLRTERGGAAWKQTIAYPFQLMRQLARGDILQVQAISDRYETKQYGDVPVVDATATHDEESGRVAIFVANRSLTDQATVEIDVRGLTGASGTVQATSVHTPPGRERKTTNTAIEQRAVVPTPLTDVAYDGGRVSARLPALSWTAIEVS